MVRGVVIAAVVLCLVVALRVLTTGTASERYTLHAVNAGQLVKGNLVKIGGAKAGLVRSIELGRAQGRGARFEIRLG